MLPLDDCCLHAAQVDVENPAAWERVVDGIVAPAEADAGRACYTARTQLFVGQQRSAAIAPLPPAAVPWRLAVSARVIGVNITPARNACCWRSVNDRKTIRPRHAHIKSCRDRGATFLRQHDHFVAKCAHTVAGGRRDQLPRARHRRACRKMLCRLCAH